MLDEAVKSIGQKAGMVILVGAVSFEPRLREAVGNALTALINWLYFMTLLF
jgi:hypothetical protein